MTDTPHSPQGDRRGFLATTAIVLGAIPIVGGLVTALRVALASPATQRPERLELCRKSDVPADGLVERTISFRVRRGAVVENVSRVVFVTRDPDDGDRIIAMSGECTHLTCPVQKRTVTLDSGDAPLSCPCHGGAFSRTGEVLGGPPPAPLTRFELEIPDDEDGMIHVLAP